MARKLLLADDSITIQKVVELILKDEGFDIRTASDGEEALAAIPSFKPDVILADIEMPRINGYQLCERIKQVPSMRGIPVILLSPAFEPIDEKLAVQVNADDFIIKPFESQELINKINAVLAVSTLIRREEGESITEAVEFEKATVREDLWAVEEIPEGTEAEAWSAEKGAVAGTEELVGITEEPEVEAKEAETEETILPVSEKPEAVPLPSKDEIKEIFENSVNNSISSLLSALDIKEAILALLMPSIKDSAEKLLSDTLPDIIEKTLKEELREKPEAVPLPSKDEIKEIFENSVNNSISSLLSALDIKEAFFTSLMPSIKDYAEKILLETIPDLTEKVLSDALKAPIDNFTKGTENFLNDTLPDIIEKTLKEELRISFEYLMKETGKVMYETLPEIIKEMLKQQLKDSLESLIKEIEKAIWETIPDLAETMISKEIERIRSEF